MKIVLVAAVALALLQCVFADEEDCDEGEVYKTGQSSTCGEHQCGEPESGVKPCTYDYVSRCFCKDDLYRRKSDHKCVPKDEC
ncbi:hypothetical protein V5799_003101 [Amblyomma americanum]|uniref:Secreted protein n=1 Tax=Amblyomma americanum TaxID=6943 RepID=A0AAQ4D9W7_AMBAM